jgi:hypothetical protein
MVDAKDLKSFSLIGVWVRLPLSVIQMKPVINIWANFLMNEKLSPERVGEENIEVLIYLCEKLAEKSRPNISCYQKKIETRRLVVNTAMDLGLDLPAITHNGKMAMARSLIDIWNEEYCKRFGSNIGTSTWKEVIRRNIKSNETKN